MAFMKRFCLLVSIVSLFGLSLSSVFAQNTANTDSVLNTIPYGKMLRMSSEEVLPILCKPLGSALLTGVMVFVLSII